MPKNYPSILIDRNRKSRSEAHKFDYVICLDRECGFVARVVLFQRVAFDEFKANLANIPDAEVLNELYLSKNGEAGIVMIIEEFIYDTALTQTTRPRIKSLLAKCMKKYLYAESATAPSGMNISLDSQILVLEDIIKDLKAGYDKMVAHAGEHRAQYYIANVEAAIETVRMLRKMSN